MTTRTHLSDADLARLVAELARPEELSAWLAHAADCEDCRELLRATMESVRDEPRADASDRSDESADESKAGLPRSEASDAPRGLAEVIDEPSLSQERVYGRYILLEVLGGGAMGVVYSAYDPRLERKVALKVLRPGIESVQRREQRQLLAAEARLLAQLQHPAVVTVHELGTELRRGPLGEAEEPTFIAMELVEGQTLDAWAAGMPSEERTRSLSLRRLLVQACEGLDAAHRAGVLHRDIKPANLVVEKGADGLEPRLKLADFGLASRAESAEGETSGTPRYMAPELLRGAGATPCSDRYALACVVVELLSGRAPFAGERSIADLELAKRQPPELSRDLPRRIRQVLRSYLDPEPARRPVSLAALQAALLPERPPWLLPALGLGLASTLALLGAMGVVALQRVRAEQASAADCLHHAAAPERAFAALIAGGSLGDSGFQSAFVQFGVDLSTVRARACRVSVSPEEARCVARVSAQHAGVLLALAAPELATAKSLATISAGLDSPLSCVAEPSAPEAQAAREDFARLAQVETQLAAARAEMAAGRLASAAPRLEWTALELEADGRRAEGAREGEPAWDLLRCELSRQRAMLATAQAQRDAARSHSARTVSDCLRANRPGEAALAASRIVRILQSLPGATSESQAWEGIGDALAASVPATDTAFRSTWGASRSLLHLDVGEYAAALQWADQALAHTDDRAHDALAPFRRGSANLHYARGLALLGLLRPEEAAADFGRASEQMRAGGRAGSSDALLAVARGAEAWVMAGRADKALELLSAARDAVSPLRATLRWALLLDSVDAVAREALEGGGGSGLAAACATLVARVSDALGHAESGGTGVDLGDVVRALSCMGEVSRAERERLLQRTQALLRPALGERRWTLEADLERIRARQLADAGRIPQALSAIARAQETRKRALTVPVHPLDVLVQAELAWQAGDRRLAEAAADRTLKSAGSFRGDFLLPRAHWLRGRLAAAKGDTAAAREAGEQALATSAGDWPSAHAFRAEVEQWMAGLTPATSGSGAQAPQRASQKPPP